MEYNRSEDVKWNNWGSHKRSRTDPKEEKRKEKKGNRTITVA